MKRKQKTDWGVNLVVGGFFVLVAGGIFAACAGWNEWLYDDWRCMFKNCRVLVP